MARALVRVGVCLLLWSGVGLWSPSAAAQAGGEIIDDESESEDGQQDQAAEEPSNEDDAGDGDWSEGGSAASESGFHFGLRLGYGFALGKATGAASSSSSSSGGTTTTSFGSGAMSDNIAGQIPLWVDAGWQFTPSFMLGAYFSYGFVLPSGDLADACDSARASCTLNDIRLGVQAQLSFAPGRPTEPWLGVGAGYEWFSLNVNDATFRLHGFELLMLQGGIDFGGDSGGSSIGPFAAFTFGQFSRAKIKFGSIDETVDVDEKATHNWLFVGIRGVVK